MLDNYCRHLGNNYLEQWIKINISTAPSTTQIHVKHPHETTPNLVKRIISCLSITVVSNLNESLSCSRLVEYAASKPPKNTHWCFQDWGSPDNSLGLWGPGTLCRQPLLWNAHESQESNEIPATKRNIRNTQDIFAEKGYWTICKKWKCMWFIKINKDLVEYIEHLWGWAVSPCCYGHMTCTCPTKLSIW